MFRKQKPDQEVLNSIREEMIILQKFENDVKTDTGKNLLKFLDENIQSTVREFAFKEVEKFDSDTKIIVFFSACRSKLQTLLAIKKMYEEASIKRKQLADELEKILQKEE